ncbi:MAG TPA: tetratricopeptide repeat protein [Actinomycetota bacterium]
MSSAPEPIEIEVEEVRDPFSRAVAIAIVVATLSGAMVGYAQSRASRASSFANVDAQQSLVRAMGGLVRADQAAQVDYHTFALAELLRHEAADVRQLSFARDSRLLRLEQARLAELARRTQSLTSITTDGEDGPERDPIFPFRFFSDSQLKADLLWALADAANEEDGAWEGREANYTAVLTLFAVAVYLLGLSLSLRIRIRRMLAAVGIGLIVVGGVWAVWLAVHTPARAPAEAAEAFADGRRALLLATGPEGYREAESHFSRSIGLRPTFAQAYVERAGARFLAGSPQSVYFGSLSTPGATRAAVTDLRTALELGLETRAVLGELGFETFLLGLQESNSTLIEESAGFTARAIALDPTDPVLRYNLGVARLATGDVAGAREAYRVGALSTIYEDPDLSPAAGEDPPPGATGQLGQRAPEPQGNLPLQQQWLSGALTDLELLVSHRPETAEVAAQLKEYLVGSVSRGEPGIGEATEAGTAEVNLFPAEAQWRALLPGFDPEDDLISQQWYLETPQGWSGIPEVSGVRTPGLDRQDRDWFRLESLVTSTFPARCLSDGRYRVELYVNGHLTATAEGEAAFGSPQATVLRDLSVAMCRPPGWEPLEDPVAGFFGGAVAPDRTAGAYIFRFQHPDLVAGRDPTAAVTPNFIDVSVENFAELLPDGVTFDSELEDPYFMGLDAPAQGYYAYPGGYVIGAAGVAEDGAVIVGLVFGPAKDFNEGGAALQLFDSLTEYAPLV